MTPSTNVELPSEIISWMGVIAPLLQESAWRPVLTIGDIDIWEILRSPIYLLLLKAARDPVSDISKNNHSAVSWIQRQVDLAKIKVREYLTGRISATPIPSSVVFWPTEPTHVKVQRPVANVLRNRDIEVSFVSNRAKTVDQLHQYGNRITYTRDKWKREINVARKMGEKTCGCLDQLPNVVLPDFPIPLHNTLILNLLRQRLIDLVPHVHEMIATTKSILEDMKPSALVVGNDITLEGRSATFCALSYALPTISIMHGNAYGPLHNYHIVDQFLVYGPEDRRRLVTGNVTDSRAVVTGATYLDNLPKQNGQIHPAITAKLNLASSKLFVLILTSGPGDSVSLSHHITMIENVMRVSSKLKNVTFIAKLHRKDQVHYYDQARHRVSGERLIVIRDNEPGFPIQIFDWLQGCSLVLTGASTAAVEAMLMNVPVISMDFANELHDIYFIQKKATHHVTSLESLAFVTEGLLTKRMETEAQEIAANARAVIREIYGDLDGKASQRAADAIVDAFKHVDGFNSLESL